MPTKSADNTKPVRSRSTAKAAPSASPAEPVSRAGKPRASGLRSLWKGAISFGMVSIPVKLYPATSSRDLSFNLLHAACNSRLKQMRWCPKCEREVPWEEIVRGYEYSKDRYVRLSEEDFDKIPVPSKHTIELSAFVHQAEIDPVYFEKSYYLEPESVGRKSFALLLRALEEKRRTAVAKIAIRDKERLCALRPYQGTLMLETLFYADEIRAQAESDVQAVQVSERELDMAYQLIEYLSEPFHPQKYHDEYRTALTAVIEAKLHGEQIVAAPAAAESNLIDLMDALRASLEAAKKQKKADPAPAKRSRRGAA